MISERYFTEIVNKGRFEVGNILSNCEHFSYFSLKLKIQFLKYFHNMVFCSAGSQYYQNTLNQLFYQSNIRGGVEWVSGGVQWVSES